MLKLRTNNLGCLHQQDLLLRLQVSRHSLFKHQNAELLILVEIMRRKRLGLFY